jgi:acyl carrier protein
MPPKTFNSSLARICDVSEETLQPSTVLKDLGSWDSLAEVEFVAMIDTDYGVTLDSEAIGKCQTVGALQELVEKRLSESA